ncbi:hypothetical protein SAMN05421810_11440 [Amycolatopsis arida]|uniref:NAD(P)-binding domain-containing protein n=1 Tax=Amycolatopsis arida TaxID=587909 RepID=A0A1I6ARU3_9PSEU|nr:NAD(P)H-binding protein [Amycolatopsis arida]TDX97583.1 hypothetical protein CLV69_102687 [Amycolatopsis arida]SFQ71336.1 hypothetical protein SAMN05421810_11440 [Amycolatopsis arida]
MRIVVVGAAGMVGSRVTAEAARRGHDITAVVRTDPARTTASVAPPPGVAVAVGDAADRDRTTPLFTAADAVVGAVRPAPGREHTVAETTTALLDAAAASRTRILLVGGAGALRSPDGSGRLAVDDPAFVPPRWRAIAMASVAQLGACRGHPADWVYLSPPATLEPGRRTGTYRRGGTTLLTTVDGSWISAEDLAVAVLDELERPGGDRHFTVAH